METATTDKIITPFVKTGQTVFFCRVEEVWNKPWTMKRSDVYDTRSVILRGEVISVQGDEFKAKLFGNNGFEKDGEAYVFHKGTLLADQNFTDLKRLGIWSDPK